MMGLLLPIIMASLAGTVLWAVQWSLRPVTERAFSQAWHYYTGLVPVFFLLGGSAISNRLIEWLHNAGAPLLVIGQGPSHLPSVSTGEYVPMLANLVHQESVIRFATAAWAVGALAYLAVGAWNYWAFKRSVLTASRVCDAVPCSIRVIISTNARTPMLMGLWRPILVLPDTPFADKELAMIMSHELVHFRRGDLFVKLLVFLANAVHWFNPAVYVLNKQLNTLCELSCDEKVVQAMDPENRRFTPKHSSPCWNTGSLAGTLSAPAAYAVQSGR